MSEVELLKAPFPWFGGKRRVADVVWRAFGNVPNYIEPFFGSGAVLLGRPHDSKIETINDINRYLANFWRAVQSEPLAVAEWANGPVNEADLHARHKWLVNQVAFRERMHQDPDFFDVKIAGWWVWGLCQWIGAGWCVEPNNHKHPKLDGIGKGVHSDHGHGNGTLWNKRPGMSHAGSGVHSNAAHESRLSQQMPKLSVTDNAAGAGGVHTQELVANAYSPGRRPALSDAGSGVHLPSLGNDRGINGVSAPPAADWFLRLQHRLRRTRVACGDWKRVLGNSVLGKGKNVGGRRPCAVFLDPPYDDDMRASYLYSDDAPKLSTEVRDWAIAHGDDPDIRIALCGYEGEHKMPENWTKHAWTAARGYAGADNDNRELERIWFSPHCLSIETQRSLFGEAR